jgi:hypothetical protein
MNVRLLLACCFVLGCGGSSASSGEKGTDCRAQTDCNSPLGCLGPDEGPVCGVAPQHGCETTDGCGSGSVCNAIIDSCSDSGVGSMCGTPCNATSCGAGFRCSTTSVCEPIPCDEGFTCAAHQRCDTTLAHDTSGPVYDHSHGCVNVACAKDADCPESQFCVNAFCQTAPGTCQEIIAVP